VDPSGLSALTNLQTLWLDGNQIVDPSGLSALTNLQTLGLGGNQIVDPSGLSALTKAGVRIYGIRTR
jgi:Leucine-rich repeat (LRR) protein